jgi:hypothetical protein
MIDSKETNIFERNPKKFLLVFYLFLIICIELMLRLLASHGVVTIAYYPTSNIQNKYLGDINEHFGVWHYPNREVHMRSPCYDVVYTSNSYGARDIEREKQASGSKRFVVLGDSFVEGVGVSLESRMTNLIEDQTGYELLNFGVSGNFSSTQEWLLYREMASKFEHDEVAIFVLPDNDFLDNDPTQFGPSRYRPYLRKKDDGAFEVYYPVEFQKGKEGKEISIGRKIRRTVYNNFYLLNILKQIGRSFEESDFGDFVDQAYQNRVSYDDFNDLDIARVSFAYKQIAEESGFKKIRVFIIPRESDLDAYSSGNNKLSVVNALKKSLADAKGIYIYDLLPFYVEYAKKQNVPYDKFFHACDGHWSNLGNKVAADAVVNILSDS